MSRDAQHRQRPTAEVVTELVAARLAAAGRHVPTALRINVCPICDSARALDVQHDLVSDAYTVACKQCGVATPRAYFDPIDAIARWNAIPVPEETTP